MKKLLLAATTLLLLSASSCTKVVDIDLNKSNPQYIVEAEVTNMDLPQTVHITRSVNFSEMNDYPPVTNAIVTISDNFGNLDTLIQDQPGYYMSMKIKGIPGRTYALRISVDGHQFTATSTIPPTVAIDTLKMVEQSSFGKVIKAPQVTFHEPQGTGNYYHFMVYKNHQRIKTLYIDNDLANDGTIIERTLTDIDSTYLSNDKVCVDLQCISKEMYDYYFSLQQTIGQSSATPANPITNIHGSNVTGYFSAHTAHRLKLIVP